MASLGLPRGAIRLDDTLGAAFLGHVVTIAFVSARRLRPGRPCSDCTAFRLYGITTGQAFLYFERYGRGRRRSWFWTQCHVRSPCISYHSVLQGTHLFVVVGGRYMVCFSALCSADYTDLTVPLPQDTRHCEYRVSCADYVLLFNHVAW